MPKTITKEITLYTFRELLDLEIESKKNHRGCEKAREWLHQGATNHDWWEGVYETWTSALSQIGFTEPDISFSGFWSQGDGASFTCDSVDMELLIDFMSTDIPPSLGIGYDGDKEDFRGYIVFQCDGVTTNNQFQLLNGKVSGSINRTSHSYSHARTCQFNLDEYEEDHETVATAFEKACEKLRIDICRAIYDALEAEYEWRTSDAQLEDDAEANGWLFTIDGEMETE